jgi:hypothetical protein
MKINKLQYFLTKNKHNNLIYVNFKICYKCCYLGMVLDITIERSLLLLVQKSCVE